MIVAGVIVFTFLISILFQYLRYLYLLSKQKKYIRYRNLNANVWVMCPAEVKDKTSVYQVQINNATLIVPFENVEPKYIPTGKTYKVKIDDEEKQVNDAIEKNRIKINYKHKEYEMIGNPISSGTKKLYIAYNPFIQKIELPENLTVQDEIYTQKEMKSAFNSDFLDFYFDNKNIKLTETKLQFKISIKISILLSILAGGIAYTLPFIF